MPATSIATAPRSATPACCCAPPRNALGQASLVIDLIKAKQLVAPVPRRLKTGFGYYLVHPLGADARPEIKVFKDWIVVEGEEGVTR